MKPLIPALALALLVWIAPPSALGQHGPHQHQQSDDRAQITAVMMKEFDRQDARLNVDPVVVDGDVAVAGWTQDGRGGRALMRRMKGQWTIALCSGESLRLESGLKQFGLAPDIAGRLAVAVAHAEASLSRQTIALLDSFDGTVVIGEDGRHPPAHGSGAHSHGAHGQGGHK